MNHKSPSLSTVKMSPEMLPVTRGISMLVSSMLSTSYDRLDRDIHTPAKEDH